MCLVDQKSQLTVGRFMHKQEYLFSHDIDLKGFMCSCKAHSRILGPAILVDCMSCHELFVPLLGPNMDLSLM